MAISGCAGEMSTVDPAGPAAARIATLWWVMLAGGTLIFALVAGLIVAAFVKKGDGTASTRVWIVGLGLVFSLSVLAALLVYALVIGEQLLPRAGRDVVSVGAEARMWSWTFTYDDAPGVTTENVLHIPAGRPIDVAITTVDVIHSFWVPRLAGKLDAIPGHVNILRIEADRPGSYRGASGEFSGDGYAGHKFTVVAHDEAGWMRFLAEARP